MRALVTGGAGSVGSHVVDRLLEEGYEVEVLRTLGHAEPRAAPNGGGTEGLSRALAASFPILAPANLTNSVRTTAGARSFEPSSRWTSS